MKNWPIFPLCMWKWQICPMWPSTPWAAKRAIGQKAMQFGSLPNHRPKTIGNGPTCTFAMSFWVFVSFCFVSCSFLGPAGESFFLSFFVVLYHIAQHDSPTTSDLEVNLSAGNLGFGGFQMKVPSNLMPFLHQNGGVLARCGMRTLSHLRARMVMEVNNCGMLWWEVPK